MKKERTWRKADGSKIEPKERSAPIIDRTPDLFDVAPFGPNAAPSVRTEDRRTEICFFAQDPDLADASPAERAMHFMQGLIVPEGPLAGKPISLPPFQRRFIEGALA